MNFVCQMEPPRHNGLKENAKKGKEKENQARLDGIHKSRNLKDIRNGSNTSYILSFLSIKLRRLKVWETNGMKYSNRLLDYSES